MKHIYVAVKGQLPTDLNNPTGQMQPGYIASYTITDDKTLTSELTKTPTALPFGIVEHDNNEGLYLAPDVSTGYTTFRFGSDAITVPGTIPLQKAVSGT